MLLFAFFFNQNITEIFLCRISREFKVTRLNYLNLPNLNLIYPTLLEDKQMVSIVVSSIRDGYTNTYILLRE